VHGAAKVSQTGMLFCANQKKEHLAIFLCQNGWRIFGEQI